MVLNIHLGDWDRFVERYRRDESQWYLVPKAKTYDESTIKELTQGLAILQRWFCEPERLKKDEHEKLGAYVREPQQNFFGDEGPFIKWGNAGQVLFTSTLFKEGLISREQQSEDLRAQFDEIIESVTKGESYGDIEKRFGTELLITKFAANSRNFINICQRLGLAWIKKDHLVAVTSVGKRLIEAGDNYKPVLEQQLRRLQFYNPTYERRISRYGHVRVFPFNFCLQLIVGLAPHQITKEEFALFVTKAVTMSDVSRCVEWIRAFRSLSETEKDSVLDNVGKRQRKRSRSLFAESMETASKNINFLTLTGPWVREVIGNSEGIVLNDIRKAGAILAEDNGIEFVDYESKESWLCYYGDVTRKSDVESAIDYYARKGKEKKAQSLTKRAPDVKRAEKKLRQRLEERHVENFYIENLDLIEKGMRLYRENGRNGQQFETPDGGIIDLLAVTFDGSFVVIEFKRDKTSDESMGQLLRYMGWVWKNLSLGKTVRGYIVALDFDVHARYALYGMQHPLIPNPKGEDLIKLYRHGINISEMGAVKLNGTPRRQL